MSDRLIHQPANEEFDIPVMARRRRWIIFASGIAVVLVFLLLGYTQTESFGREILHSVQSRSNETSISAGSFHLVGMSRLVGSEIRVVEEDGKQVFSCRSLDVEFDLLEFLLGRLGLDSVAIEGGQLEVIEKENGETSIDALWSQFSRRSRRSQQPLKEVDVDSIRLSDCGIRFSWEERPSVVLNARKLNLLCQPFAPGADSTLNLESSLDLVSDESAAVSLDVKGTIKINLRESGVPRLADGIVSLSFGEGTGRLSDLAGAEGEIKLAVQPEEVEESGLRLFRDDEELGSILVSGPFDSRRMEGRLTIKTDTLKRPILNLFSVVSGLDFGETALRTETTVNWAFGGSVVSARGQLEASNLELLKGPVRTPKTEFFSEYSLQYSDDDDSLLLQKCRFRASSGGVDWLTGGLGAPVIFSWGDARPGIKEPKFDFTVKDLDMRAWASFFLVDIPPGRLSLDATTSIQKDGQLIVSKVEGDVKDLEILTPADLSLQTDLDFEFGMQLDEMKRLSLIDINYSLREGDLDLLKGTGVYSLQFDDASYSFQIVSRGPAPWISEHFGIEALELSAGDLDAMLRVQSKDDSYDVVLNAGLSDLVGRYGGMVFEDHRFESKLDLKAVGRQVLLNNFNVRARKAYTSAGSIGFNGQYDIEDETGSVRFQSVGINRHLFGAMLDARIQADRLGEAELKIEGQLDFDRKGESRLNAKIGVGQLKRTLEEGAEEAMLDFDFAGDAVITGERLILSEGTMSLAETARGNNQLRIKADFPLDLSAVGKGKMTIDGDTVDLSEYWSLYRELRSESKETVRTSTEDSIQRDVVDGADEGGWQSTLGFDSALAELYLADLAVTNFVAKSTLGRELLVVDELAGDVNGGSVRGLLAAKQRAGATDLSIDLSVSDVPIAPMFSIWANTNRVAVEGTLNAQVRLDGRLGDGVDEKTNLSGLIEGVLIEPVFPPSDSGQTPWLTPVLRALRLPRIDHVNFDRIYTSVKLDEMIAEVEELSLDADLLKLSSSGSVPLGHPLALSLVNLPVDILVEEGLGRKSGLPTMSNESSPGFGLLPAFLSIQGELRKPRFEVDSIALTKILLQAVANGLPDDREPKHDETK